MAAPVVAPFMAAMAATAAMATTAAMAAATAMATKAAMAALLVTGLAPGVAAAAPPVAQRPAPAPAARPLPSIVVCLDEHPHPPHILANGDGTAPLLLRMAARQAGMSLRLYRAPTRRCLAEMRSGAVHGFAAAAPGPTVNQEFMLPRTGNAPDPARAVTTIRQLVYRRAGSAVAWDGERLTGLARPVLIGTAFVSIADRLRQLGADVDDHASVPAQNLEKLLAGRGDALVAIDTDMEQLLRQPRYAGTVEALPAPFAENHHYLIVTPAYYQANQAAVEALWDAIGTVRVSAAYAAAAARLIGRAPVQVVGKP